MSETREEARLMFMSQLNRIYTQFEQYLNERRTNGLTDEDPTDEALKRLQRQSTIAQTVFARSIFRIEISEMIAKLSYGKKEDELVITALLDLRNALDSQDSHKQAMLFHKFVEELENTPSQ